MCVGLPGRIVEFVDRVHSIARVDIAGKLKDISTAILDSGDEDLEVGDWVEIHSGFALAKLDEDQARQMREWMEELDAAHRSTVDEYDDTAG